MWMLHQAEGLDVDVEEASECGRIGQGELPGSQLVYADRPWAASREVNMNAIQARGFR